MSTILERQNRVIIELLARSTIGVKEIEKIVRAGKQKENADNYVRAYNQLDGTQSVTDIARIVNVSKQAMSSVIQTWEEKGIVYNMGSDTKPVYMGLLKLPIARNSSKGKDGKAKSKVKEVAEGDLTNHRDNPPLDQAPELQDDSIMTDRTEGQA